MTRRGLLAAGFALLAFALLANALHALLAPDLAIFLFADWPYLGIELGAAVLVFARTGRARSHAVRAA